MDKVFTAISPAGEFAKYWQLVFEDPMPEISFAIDPSISKSGNDAYSFSLADGRLEVRGSNLRSQFYAVYDYFRRQGCRWYWDGDSIPARGKARPAPLSFTEESRFEFRGIRYFAHRGLTRFQAEHWGPEEWKKEIDWCLKNRLNLFMPRIGMDDTWQKAFPDIVPYPDPEEKLPEALEGYDDRSLFWSLQYRGELRLRFTKYARSLGLSIPVDFGTMTHWYSRTPLAYLKSAHPEFLPQRSSGYSQETGLVFDVRKPEYLDVYWRLSEAFMEAGYGTPELMHTIGLGERMVFADRAENHKLKVDVIRKLCGKVADNYPDSKVLLAGWDFYNTWSAEEVQALLAELDPAKTVIFDYEADARKGDVHKVEGGKLFTDFTQWGVVGKFPYVFGIFLCYESGIDIRADYELIAERQKAIAGDPMCKGYILWPEASHTDTFCLEYFTANSWNGESAPVVDMLKNFCASRYGADAPAMERAWNLLLHGSSCAGWGSNCVQELFYWSANYNDDPGTYPKYAEVSAFAESAPAIFRELASLDWSQPAVQRDAIDIARTACDRVNLFFRQKLFRSFDKWVAGEGDAQTVLEAAGEFDRMADILADILELHTDYSLYESLLRLDAIEKIRFRGFERTLKDNASAGYCRSHQYEVVRYWYVPLVNRFTAEIRRRISAGERKSMLEEKIAEEWNLSLKNEFLDRPLEKMRPTAPRTRAAFMEVVRTAAE